MKRDKYTHPNITKIYPIFLWKECRFCGREFKKEYGFKITKENECQCCNEDPKYNTTYCCSDCCKDENEVIQRLNIENDYRKEQQKRKYNNIGSNPEPKTKRPGIPKKTRNQKAIIKCPIHGIQEVEIEVFIDGREGRYTAKCPICYRRMDVIQEK